MFEVKSTGPSVKRESIKFSDWDAPGIVIANGKTLEDAKGFREAASLLSGLREERAKNLAVWLRNMAAQYDAAAAGQEIPKHTIRE